MILHRQLEVGQGYGDEGRHYQQNDEDNEENGIDGVHFMAPHTGKDVVQLNVDGAEWQEACSHHIRMCVGSEAGLCQGFCMRRRAQGHNVAGLGITQLHRGTMLQDWGSHSFTEAQCCRTGDHTASQRHNVAGLGITRLQRCTMLQD